MIKNKYNFDVQSDTKNLEKIATFVEKTLKVKKIKQDIIDEILVSVDEAATNIMLHSYNNKHNGHVKLMINCSSNKVIISLFDTGSTFKPNQIPQPDFSKNLSERTIGGLGLFLMRQFMDDIQFFFKNSQNKNENEVRMVKYY